MAGIICRRQTTPSVCFLRGVFPGWGLEGAQAPALTRSWKQFSAAGSRYTRLATALHCWATRLLLRRERELLAPLYCIHCVTSCAHHTLLRSLRLALVFNIMPKHRAGRKSREKRERQERASALHRLDVPAPSNDPSGLTGKYLLFLQPWVPAHNDMSIPPFYNRLPQLQSPESAHLE